MRCPLSTRTSRLLATASLLAACLSFTACNATEVAGRTPPNVVIMTGPLGGAYNPLGHALATVYNREIKTATFVAQDADGPTGAGGNAQSIELGKSDLAFVRSDIAYLSYRNGNANGTSSHLRSMAVLYTNAVHFLVRRGSGINRATDIRGHRVQASDEADGSTLTRMVLEGYGIKMSDVVPTPSSRTALSKLKTGELDVRIFASAYPLASIDGVGEESGIRLLSIEPEVIDRLRSRFPFFKPATIPKGTYVGQTEDVQTVGIDGLLLCRDTLTEDLVYDMTRRLFDALPELATSQPSARLISVGRAPATPVPLHPGAARYYRERDLFR